jgi:hypothetical protein
MTRSPARVLAATALAMFAILAVACSSDEEAGDTTTSEKEESLSSTTEAGGGSEGSEGTSTTIASGDTTAADPSATEGCEAISQVQDLQSQMDQVMTQSQDWAEVQTAVSGLRPEIAEFYEMAALAAPEVADALTTVGEFTDEGLTAMEEAPDMDQYIATVEELPGMQDAVDATLAVDAWTQENCGFSFAG